MPGAPPKRGLEDDRAAKLKLVVCPFQGTGSMPAVASPAALRYRSRLQGGHTMLEAKIDELRSRPFDQAQFAESIVRGLRRDAIDRFIQANGDSRDPSEIVALQAALNSMQEIVAEEAVLLEARRAEAKA